MIFAACPICGSHPVHIFGTGRCLGKHHHGALAVGEVGVAGQVVAWLFSRGGFGAAHIPDQRDVAGLQEFIKQVIASVVHIGIDFVRSQIPGLIRKTNADIPADLADPDRLALEAERRQPEPQMQALIDGLPDSLQCEVLAAFVPE